VQGQIALRLVSAFGISIRQLISQFDLSDFNPQTL